MLGRVVAAALLVHPGDEKKAETRHPEITTADFQLASAGLHVRTGCPAFI